MRFGSGSTGRTWTTSPLVSDRHCRDSQQAWRDLAAGIAVGADVPKAAVEALPYKSGRNPSPEGKRAFGLSCEHDSSASGLVHKTLKNTPVPKAAYLGGFGDAVRDTTVRLHAVCPSVLHPNFDHVDGHGRWIFCAKKAQDVQYSKLVSTGCDRVLRDGGSGIHGVRCGTAEAGGFVKDAREKVVRKTLSASDSSCASFGHGTAPQPTSMRTKLTNFSDHGRNRSVRQPFHWRRSFHGAATPSFKKISVVSTFGMNPNRTSGKWSTSKAAE